MNTEPAILETWMKVRERMSRDLRVASPASSIRDAARTMKEIDAGFLPVGERGRLVGMITDRDIAVRAVAEGKGPETEVRDVMSGEVIYCFDDEDLESVAMRVLNGRIRRLPVISREKKLIGIVSLGEFARNREDREDDGFDAAALGDVSAPRRRARSTAMG
jgi:CBS domain-containing protein